MASVNKKPSVKHNTNGNKFQGTKEPKSQSVPFNKRTLDLPGMPIDG